MKTARCEHQTYIKLIDRHGVNRDTVSIGRTCFMLYAPRLLTIRDVYFEAAV